MRNIFGNSRKALVLVLAIGLAIAGVRHNGLSVYAKPGEDVNGGPRTFVYTITNPDGANAIAAYEANQETGELIFLETYSTGGLGTVESLIRRARWSLILRERCYLR